MIVYIGDYLSVERYNYLSIFWIRFFESLPQIGKYLKVWRWLSPQVALSRRAPINVFSFIRFVMF